MHRHLVRKCVPQIFGHLNISVIFSWDICGSGSAAALIKLAWITQDRTVFALNLLDLAVCVCKEKGKAECQPYSLE